ncbi:hypothetical protein WAI453_005231 [Rhynchosporium graminicola]
MQPTTFTRLLPLCFTLKINVTLRYLYLPTAYRDVNDHNGFYLSDLVPRGNGGYIHRNAKVFDPSNRVVGYCSIGFQRVGDCKTWFQVGSTRVTSGGAGLCDGKKHTLSCTPGS